MTICIFCLAWFLFNERLLLFLFVLLIYLSYLFIYLFIYLFRFAVQSLSQTEIGI